MLLETLHLRWSVPWTAPCDSARRAFIYLLRNEEIPFACFLRDCAEPKKVAMV